MIEIVYKQPKIVEKREEIKVCENNNSSKVHTNIECTKRLIEKEHTISTMESCTSGLIASMLTDTEGASEILKGAFITYSNEAKVMQGVPKETIEEYGVYSYETALDMAVACKKAYNSDYGIGVTGTTGNIDPNNNDSVQGTIYFCILDYKYHAHNYKLSLDTKDKTRNEIKNIIAGYIFDKLWEVL